jgi:hypothetical protein
MLLRPFRPVAQSSVRHFGKYSGYVATHQPQPTSFDRFMGVCSKRIMVPLPLVLFGGSVTLQYYLGTQDDFFKGSFITTKDPDALAEFYQAEDLLKIIAIHPIMFNLFMNKVDPQETSDLGIHEEETGFKVKYLGMEVAFKIEEEEEDGVLTSFKRLERFIDWVPILDELGRKWMLWDQTWTYGFRRLEDGNIEVYHHGQKFVGPWPVRLIVFFHQYYVLWACEKHINSEAFGTEDLDTIEEQMACLPLHQFKKLMGNLRDRATDKLKALEENKLKDKQAIARHRTAISKFDDLYTNNQSSLSVTTRQATGSSGGELGVKFVAKDEATQEALALMMEGKGSDSDVRTMLKEMIKNPDLQFKPRARKDKRINLAMASMPYHESKPTKPVIEVSMGDGSVSAPAVNPA